MNKAVEEGSTVITNSRTSKGVQVKFVIILKLNKGHYKNIAYIGIGPFIEAWTTERNEFGASFMRSEQANIALVSLLS